MMIVLLFFATFFLSFKLHATSIATCTTTIKVVDHKTEKNCGKQIETHCDNVAANGLYFPKGTTLVYSCDFKDIARKPLKILRAEVSESMKIGKDIISPKSEIYFAEDQLYMIRFGEKQKFRGHTFGSDVTMSLNLKNSKILAISGKPGFEFDEANYNYIHFLPNGDLAAFELAEDSLILGLPIKAKEAISLVDGIYSQIVLSKPHRMGNWTFEGKLSFFKNGKVQGGFLSSVHIFEKAKLKGAVRFNDKGELIMGTLAENVVRVYDPATCGTLFMKAGDPVGFGEEGARLWPKWYPEDKPNHCPPPSQDMLKKMFPNS